MIKFLLAVVMLLLLANYTEGQVANISEKEWIKKLSDPDDRKNEWYDELLSKLKKLDSSKIFTFLNQLNQYPDAKGNYFTARFNCIKAGQLYEKNLSPDFFFIKNEQIKNKITFLLAQAMQKAYESNDDYLAAFVSDRYGSYMSAFGETEPAVMYMMNSADLYEKINLSAKFEIYSLLGEMLWRVREYEKCIKYSHKAISVFTASSRSSTDKDTYVMFCSNTIALAYHRLGQYDSAIAYYHQGLIKAQKINSPVWKGIISGNMAQIYFAQAKYATALPLFQMDYTMSNEKGFYDNAANSLQWVARTNLALGNTDTALHQVRESFRVLQKWPQANYLQNAYFTASEIFKALNNKDSAFYYSGLYTKLHDSLERVIYQSSMSIAKLRLNEEKSRYSIINLQRQKQSQMQQRNFIIMGILLLAIISVLFVNRQRLKLKFRQESLEKEKKLIENEMSAAKQQMEMFTQNIIEKTSLIEKMEQQMQENNVSAGQQETIAALSQLTILTEADWDKFKSLFEKLYPLFFQHLKTKAPDISLAEQRMAALTRLQLTTRQMASMQGISPDSVHKTRQRLRQRLAVSNETNLEEFLGTV